MEAPRKVAIFDFDGTLADSVPIIRAIYTEMAIKNKWKTLTDEDYKRLRRGSLRDARRWSGIPLWQYPLLIRAAKKLMKLEARNVKLFPGTGELIDELHAEGYDMYALSRNAPDTILKVFERYGLEKKVLVLNRRKRSLGSKTAAIKKLVRRYEYDRKYVWMIGDEVRDIQAAHKAGVNSAAVAWGIQDMSILKLFKPTRTAATVKELKQILLKADSN